MKSYSAAILSCMFFNGPNGVDGSSVRTRRSSVLREQNGKFFRTRRSTLSQSLWALRVNFGLILRSSGPIWAQLWLKRLKFKTRVNQINELKSKNIEK